MNEDSNSNFISLCNKLLGITEGKLRLLSISFQIESIFSKPKVILPSAETILFVIIDIVVKGFFSCLIKR